LRGDDMQSPGNYGEQASHEDTHGEGYEIGVADSFLDVAADKPPDNLFLKHRTDAAQAIDQPRNRHGVLLARHLHRSCAAQQRVRAIEHETHQAEPDRHGTRTAAELDDGQVTRDHAEPHAGTYRGPVAFEPAVERPAGQEHSAQAGEIEDLRVVTGAGDIESLDIQESGQPRVEGIPEKLDAEVTCPHSQDDRVRGQLSVLL